jgi:hypothetical protein
MQILYLTDGLPDYLADQIYVGLCRVLGPDQVVDFPFNAHYHLPSQKLSYLTQIPGTPYEEDDIVALIRERKFDLMVLSAVRSGVIAIYERLARKVPLPSRVMIDGEDDAHIRRELSCSCGASLYFKREYRRHREGGFRGQVDRLRKIKSDNDVSERVYPLPFAIVPETVPFTGKVPKDVDISYVARASHSKRVKAVRLLRGSKGIRFEGGLYAVSTDRQSKLLMGVPKLLMKLKGDPYVTAVQLGEKLSTSDYIALLQRSKMALSIRGGGFDTLRYWEIVASRTLLISEEPDIFIPNNFVHGEHAIFCKPDLSDLIELVQTYARDEKACAAMAEAGHAHFLKYHTCERRGAYLLELCRRYV